MDPGFEQRHGGPVTGPAWVDVHNILEKTTLPTPTSPNSPSDAKEPALGSAGTCQTDGMRDWAAPE